MKRLLIKLLILLKVVFISTWIQNPEGNRTELFEITISILTSCYKDNREIVINSNFNSSAIGFLHFQKRLVINLYDSSKIKKKKELKNKIDSFIITLNNSVDEFDKVIQEFQKSSWWNVMTPFFVLSGSKNSCSGAIPILKTIWKMDVLTCYFICLNSDKITVMYTFNPYSKYAPVQWKIVAELNNSSDYMAIYRKIYRKEKVCKGFNFDRTKYLDKAVIKIAGCIINYRNRLPMNLPKKHKFFQLNFFQKQILKALKTSIKGSVKFDYDFEAPEILKHYGVFNLLRNKTSDFAMCFKSHSLIHDYPASYPIVYTHYTILSNNQGYLTPLEKIYKFYDVLMISATIIISLISYIVIWFAKKSRDHSFAVFEILRLWTSNSIITKIDTLSMRLFFFVIFLYFLILQATFQGHLEEFLIKPTLRPNAELVSDLESSSYQSIYVTNVSKPIVGNSSFLGSKIKTTNFWNCTSAVLKDKSATCIGDYGTILDSYIRRKVSKEEIENLYLSKNSLRNNYAIYAVRKDWPLKQRFDKFLMLLEASGISLKLRRNLTAYLESIILSPPNFDTFQQISLESLLFIFYFWIFGILCSLTSFVLEIYVINVKMIHKVVIIKKNTNQKLMNQKHIRKKYFVNKFLNEIDSNEYFIE